MKRWRTTAFKRSRRLLCTSREIDFRLGHRSYKEVISVGASLALMGACRFPPLTRLKRMTFSKMVLVIIRPRFPIMHLTMRKRYTISLTSWVSTLLTLRSCLKVNRKHSLQKSRRLSLIWIGGKVLSTTVYLWWNKQNQFPANPHRLWRGACFSKLSRYIMIHLRSSMDPFQPNAMGEATPYTKNSISIQLYRLIVHLTRMIPNVECHN